MARNHFVLLTLSLIAFQLQSQTPKPLWEADLSRFGYQGRPPAAVARALQDNPGEFEWTYQQGVAFAGPNVVVAYFIVRDAHPVSESPEPKISDPFRLVAVFLNAKNGEPIKQLDWPLPPDPNQVSQSFFYPAAQGRFVVVLGNTVNLYSPDFKFLASFHSHGEMTPIASPPGDSLLLRTSNAGVVQYDLLDTANLSVLKSWSGASADDRRRRIQSVWGDQFSWTMWSILYFQGPGLEPTKLLAVRPGSCDRLNSAAGQAPARSGWRSVCNVQGTSLIVPGNACGVWSFVGKGALAGPVCGGDDKLLTVSPEGKIIREFNLGLEGLDGAVVASPNGQRFAIATERRDKQAARVFDLQSGNVLLTVNVPVVKDSSPGFSFASYGNIRFGWGGLALSPDGDLLATKTGASVRIYPVPQQAVASQSGTDGKDNAESSHPQPPPPRPAPASRLVQQMLSWFPADTETLMAAIGPMQMPKMSRDAKGHLSLENSPDVVRDSFRQFFLLLSLVHLQKQFNDAPIAAAIEGSRKFHPPNGLGMATYQGGMIAVFKDDITARAAAFVKDSASTMARTEPIEGQPVWVFQDKTETGTLTSYVAFPKPNVAVVATDEDYLRDVLARIGGKRGERALPDTLPEWKHVDATAEFWALRHSPTADVCSVLPPGCHTENQKPIGITFSFSPGTSKLATIDYLSADEDTLRCIQKELFSRNERGVSEMHAQYSEAQQGVLEGTYNLEEIESAEYFSFVLEALVGHPIFV